MLIGNVFGAPSPVAIHWPMFYVDVELQRGATLELPTDYRERAVYVIDGDVADGQIASTAQDGACSRARLRCSTPMAPTRVVLLGGEPLDGPRYIWWNFVSSSPDSHHRSGPRVARGKFPKIPERRRRIHPRTRRGSALRAGGSAR